MWLECLFLDTEVDCSNPDISMLCLWARLFICIASVDSAVKLEPGGDNLVKGVQRYELFVVIALKNHTFFINDKELQSWKYSGLYFFGWELCACP